MVSTEKEIDANLADLMNDIISQDNILFSVRSSGAVCEARVEQGIALRISESYLTIGNESNPWHMHVNLNETKEARFVKENKTDGRTSYSIRFFDLKGILILRANFVKMYDSSNKIIQERLLKYEEIFAKYGKKRD